MDLLNKDCLTCKKGRYIETSIQDDIQGVLYCSKCSSKVRRHEPLEQPNIVSLRKQLIEQAAAKGRARIRVFDECSLEPEGGDWFFTNKDMNIHIFVYSSENLLEDQKMLLDDFNEEFEVLCHAYALECDELLSPGAQKLKRRLLNYSRGPA